MIMVLIRNVFKFKQTYSIYMLSFRTYLKQERHCIDNSKSSKAYLKMLENNEFLFGHSVIMKNNFLKNFNLESVKSFNTNDEFDKVIGKDWQAEPPSSLFETFANVIKFCIENNICISNKKFDNIVDSLTDKIQFASNDEIKTIFFLLCSQIKPVLTRNYIEIISALDDACILRRKEMSFDDVLLYMSLFHHLNVKACSTFWVKSLIKLARHASCLTKTQLVHIMFYIAAGGKLPTSVKNYKFELYRHIEKKITEFEIDELAVISLGLLRSEIPVYNIDLVTYIIDKIVQNSNNIHEISLLILLKMISYSLLHNLTDDNAHIDNKIYQLLDSLQNQILRLNVSCNVQIALAGAMNLVVHEHCLTKIAVRLFNLMSDTTLKDFEGILLSFGILNFVPPTVECFFSKMVNELNNKIRENEINENGEVFAHCVAHLGLSGIYPQDLMKRVLNKTFLKKTYGKSCHTYKIEILTINNLAKIFYKNEDISELKSFEYRVLSRMYHNSLPRENKIKNYNVAERRFLDIKKTLQIVRGGDNYAIGRHILTHYEKGDIVICNNHQGVPQTIDKPIPLFKALTATPDNNIWIVLILAGRSNVIHNNNKPDGLILAKSRELNKLGYCPAIVKWNIYDKCQNHDEKVEYLNTLINDAIKCKKENIEM